MTKAKQKNKKVTSDKPKDDSANGLIVVESKTQNVDSTDSILPPTNPPSTVTDSFNAPQTSQSKSTSKPWFQAEILSMMYAFGDARKPSPESARLIEEIVHQQISNLVVQTAEVTSFRGGKFMHTEDIKFLTRKDKEKLKKLTLYLSFKENKQKYVKQASQDDSEPLGSIAGADLKVGKRRRLSELGISLDQKDELYGDEAYDQRRDRLERAERLSRTLDTQQYMEFVECRQANFNGHSNTSTTMTP